MHPEDISFYASMEPRRMFFTLQIVWKPKFVSGLLQTGPMKEKQ